MSTIKTTFRPYTTDETKTDRIEMTRIIVDATGEKKRVYDAPVSVFGDIFAAFDKNDPKNAKLDKAYAPIYNALIERLYNEIGREYVHEGSAVTTLRMVCGYIGAANIAIEPADLFPFVGAYRRDKETNNREFTQSATGKAFEKHFLSMLKDHEAGNMLILNADKKQKNYERRQAKKAAKKAAAEAAAQKNNA